VTKALFREGRRKTRWYRELSARPWSFPGAAFFYAAAAAPAGQTGETFDRRVSPVITISHLTKIFEGKGAHVTALNNVSLTIEDGAIQGIIGMSGAGKSTLLRCLTLLERPTSGEILLGGQDLASLSGAALRNARRKMGVVFQGYNLLMQKTVAENIAFPLRLEKGRDKQAIDARVTELLALVGLEGRADSYPAQLSGGQKQRVAIARALAAKPELLLCDEPTSALDPLTTRAILSLLADIHEKLGVTILIITHELAVVRAICTHVAVISDGTLAEAGAVADVLEHPQSAAARMLCGVGAG